MKRHIHSAMLSLCLLAIATLLMGSSPALAQDDQAVGQEPVGKLPLTIPDEFAYRSNTVSAPRARLTSGYGNRWVVVIGIDQYQAPDGQYPSLANAASDSRAVLSCLRDEYGFMTSVDGTAIGAGIDDTRIRDTLKAWPPKERIGESDVVVFYYAGHGGPKGELIGCNGNAVPAMEIITWLKELPCRHKLLILDSCHAGSILPLDGATVSRDTLEQPAPASRSGARPQSEALEPTASAQYDVFEDYLSHGAFFALTSTRELKAADNSGFAGVLLETLHDRADSTRPDQAFTFRELAARVEVKVRNRTGGTQVPEWERLASGTGDIVFFPSHLAPTPSERALRRQYAATMEAAYNALAEMDVTTAQALLDVVRPRTDQLDLRAFDWFHLWRKTHQGSNRLPGHGPGVIDVVDLQDPSSFATVFRDGTIRICDKQTFSVQTIRYGEGGELNWSIASTGATWATLDQNREIIVADLKSGRRNAPLKLPDRKVDSIAVCMAFALSPDGKRAYWAGSYQRVGIDNRFGFGPHRVIVWDLATGQPTVDDRFQNSALGVSQFCFSEDGTRLALLVGAQLANAPMPPDEVSIVDPSSLAASLNLKGTGPNFQILDLKFDPSGPRLYASALGESGNDIVQWSLTDSNLRVLLAERVYLGKIAVSIDGSLLAGAGADGLVRLWDLKANSLIGSFAEHRGAVSTVAFAGDGKNLISGGSDGQVVLWDIAGLSKPDEITAWKVPDDGNAAADLWFAGDESTVVMHRPPGPVNQGGNIVHKSGAIEVWDLQQHKRLWSEELRPVLPGTTLVPPWRSQDGRLLVLAADNENSVFSLRNAVTGVQLGTITGPKPVQPLIQEGAALSAVAATPGGSKFALADSSGLVRVWSTDNPETVSEFRVGLSTIQSLVFHPNEASLLVGGSGAHGKSASCGLVEVWKWALNTKSFQRISAIPFRDDPVEQMEIGPKGKIVAVLSRPMLDFSKSWIGGPTYSRLGLIDISTQSLLSEHSWVDASISRFAGSVARVRFSSDERLIILEKTTSDPGLGAPQGTEFLALDPRSGVVLATLQGMSNRLPFQFSCPRRDVASAQQETDSLIISERALRFLEPFTFARSGAVRMPDFAGFPIAASASGRVIAYARFGRIGVFRAADRSETDAMEGRIRTWVTTNDAEVCAYGLGVMGSPKFPRKQVLDMVQLALRLEDWNVRRIALLRLKWEGLADEKTSRAVADRLYSRDPDERALACDALGRLGVVEDSVFASLQDKLLDPNTRVAAHAYAAAVALRPNNLETVRRFILGFEKGDFTQDALTRQMILDAVNRRLWTLPDRVGDLAHSLAIGLKKAPVDFPSYYFCSALNRMGHKATGALESLLEQMKADDQRNRFGIAIALAFIAPDDARVAEAVLPVLVGSVASNNFFPYYQSAVEALAYLGAKAKPAVADLRKIADQNVIGSSECGFAVRIIEASDAERKQILAAALTDKNSQAHFFPALAYLARTHSLRMELRPVLEELHRTGSLPPYQKQPLERILKANSADVVYLLQY